MHFVQGGKGEAEVLQLLLEANSDTSAVDGEKRTSLHQLLDQRHGPKQQECVQLLQTSKSDVNALDSKFLTPLHYAAAAVVPEAGVVQLLLEAKGDATFLSAKLQTRLEEQGVDLT